MADRLFVPFCDYVIRRYKNASMLPPHNVMDRRLHSGEIRITLTAKTPVMIGRRTPVKNQAVTFLRNADGCPIIPGSSLRGLVRQNMQILGFGLVRVGKNDEIADVRSKYNIDLSQGLPEAHRRVSPTEDVLDYANSILGFVGRQRKEGWKKIQDCYRSRVSFGDLAAPQNARECRPTPLTAYSPPDYIRNRDEKGGFTLPGTRQYPLMEPVPSPRNRNERQIQPLDRGTQFSGTIRYRNLHSDELGLLLWCLRLEKDCFHTMGMGKPYGYGRMALEINELVEYDFDQLYSSFTAAPPPRSDPHQRVDELITCYQDYALSQPGVKKLGDSLLDIPHIRHFFSLKRLPVKASDPPRAAVSNKELRKQAKKATPQASTGEVNDWKAQLSNKFKSN